MGKKHVVHYRKKFHLGKYGGSRYEMEDIELEVYDVDEKDVSKEYSRLKLKVHTLFAESRKLDEIALEDVEIRKQRSEKEKKIKTLESEIKYLREG